MRFVPLASSSAGCAYAVWQAGCLPLLVDCGLSLPKLRAALRASEAPVNGPASLVGCLVSHSHGDHCAAAAALTTTVGVDVCASKETLAALGLKGFRARALDPGRKVRVGAYDVVGFHAVHDAPGTMGFLVGSPDGGRLLYLTDSAYTPYTFDGLTHVAVEVNHDLDLMRGKTVDGQIDPVRYRRTVSNHMSLNRALDLLRAIDKRRLQEVWLLHLSDANSDEAAFKAAVQEVVGVPVHVAPRNILEVRK